MKFVSTFLKIYFFDKWVLLGIFSDDADKAPFFYRPLLDKYSDMAGEVIPFTDLSVSVGEGTFRTAGGQGFPPR